MPYFFDQFSHCRTLTERLEMGVTLKLKSLTQEKFTQAIQEVLTNPKYTKNAKKIKELVNDTPMKGKDLFLYWVNYTIRHNGAPHLVSEAPFEMNIFQYWSLDVVAFLVLVPVVVLLILVRILTFLCCSRSSEKKKME